MKINRRKYFKLIICDIAVSLILLLPFTYRGVAKDGQPYALQREYQTYMPVVFMSNYKESEGVPDPEFDSDGKVTTNINNSIFEGIRAIAVQNDRKIIAVGSFSDGINNGFALVRYRPSGDLDTSYDYDGMVATYFPGGGARAEAATIQSDGKIIAVGSTYNGVNDDYTLARYNTDGSLDNSFHEDGLVFTDIGNRDQIARGVALQPDGKIVIAGHDNNSTCFTVLRYNQDGNLDTSFGIYGGWTTACFDYQSYVSAVALQADGKIVVAGSTEKSCYMDAMYALARFNPDGSPDENFDLDGRVVTDISSGMDYSRALTLQKDGKIVLVGSIEHSGFEDIALARYNSDGSLDTSFDGDGLTTTDLGNYSYDHGNAIAIQPNGKILVAGSTEYYDIVDFILIRYNTDGSLDASFGDSGWVRTDFFGLTDQASAAAIQPDGKIIIAGSAMEVAEQLSYIFAIARYK